MGNYSRDPVSRAADAFGKRYVGVRMQQGVPVLDADWNMLDDVRRLEHEAVGRWMLGDGVPVGTDAFRVVALENGGVGTIVLRSTNPSGVSRVRVDVAASTAAAALGFTARNAVAERTGDSPAQLTGFRAGPFVLVAGGTFVVQAEDEPPETVTFAPGDFANIAAATPAEVVAVLAAQLSGVTASVGTGNDFIVRGRNPDSAVPGRIFVSGQLVMNETDITYTAQPLFQNAALAAAWGVAPVTALPATAAGIVIYLDTWMREVDSVEDPDLLDTRIGMETAIRLRREWAVRAASVIDYDPGAAPPGHSYYALSTLNRSAAQTAVQADMLTDQRETGLGLRHEVEFYGGDGMLLVTSEQMQNVLAQTRDGIRDFIAYLTETFLTPTTPYFAGEVGGISVLHATAGIAEQGLAVLESRAMDTRGALALLAQLRDAEQRVLDVWRSAVLPIERSPGVRAYENAFVTMIDAIESFLTGPAPVGYTALTPALESGDLRQAVRAQEQIASEFGGQAGHATGSLLLTYLGSPAPTILPNQPFDLQFELSGTVTPDDDIDVQVFVDGAWQTTLRNDDGSTPLALHFGPGNDTEEFIITLRPPNLVTAETTFAVLVSAHSNPGGLAHMTGQWTLRVGDPPPPAGEDYAITVLITNVPQVGGDFQVPVSFPAANLTFQVLNHTDTDASLDLQFEPLSAPGWTIVAPPGWPGASDTQPGVTVEADDDVQRMFQFGPPGTPGESLVFRLRAREAGETEILTETQITLTTVSG